MTQQDKDYINSIVPLLLSALRKSRVSCRMHPPADVISAVPHDFETGWPTNVQHITHVTFDRSNGFLGLPAELQLEIPDDYKNPENSEEDNVREQLNSGIVPDDIDVHCLAGIIKAWFRELPSGILDGLSPEQVLNCNTEEEHVELAKQLKPTEAALLIWPVDIMADVVEHEQHNKMNARNIAMVFAPNMTQTLTEREEAAGSPTSFHSSEDEYESEEETEISDGKEEAESLCERNMLCHSLKEKLGNPVPVVHAKKCP